MKMGTPMMAHGSKATVETVTAAQRAQELLQLWRSAESVRVLALPDLSVLAVECETGENGSLMAHLHFERYEGDWNALLSQLFAADIRKVSHNVKDLMRALLENGINCDGFVFDTAIAAYLLDATAGSYDLARLFVSYFNGELPKPVHLEDDAFSLLGDTAVAEAALCSYCSAISALEEELAPKLQEADGLVVASPVYYASANATLTAVLDRLFYSSGFSKTMKVGASVAVARRGGCSATFDQLNKYFTISGMPIASSQYWNSIHGGAPGQAAEDAEGLQTMRTLARNMAFLMRSIALGKAQYGLPEKEKPQFTNFIR